MNVFHLKFKRNQIFKKFFFAITDAWFAIKTEKKTAISIISFLFQLSFKGDQYFENILRVEHHDAQKNLWRLREPVRKDK